MIKIHKLDYLLRLFLLLFFCHCQNLPRIQSSRKVFPTNPFVYLCGRLSIAVAISLYYNFVQHKECKSSAVKIKELEKSLNIEKQKTEEGQKETRLTERKSEENRNKLMLKIEELKKTNSDTIKPEQAISILAEFIQKQT